MQEDNKALLERNIEASPVSDQPPPQLEPQLRNKVYLQLMKHKKLQELRELESINANIELFKVSQNSTSGNLQSSS